MNNSKITLLNILNNIRLISSTEVELYTLLTSKAITANKNVERVILQIRDNIESGHMTYQQIISYICIRAIYDKSFLFSFQVKFPDVKKVDHLLSNIQYDLDSKTINRYVEDNKLSIDDLFEPTATGGTIALDTLLKQNYIKPIYIINNLDKFKTHYENLSSENKRILRLIKQIKKTINGEI